MTTVPANVRRGTKYDFQPHSPVTPSVNIGANRHCDQDSLTKTRTNQRRDSISPAICSRDDVSNKPNYDELHGDGDDGRERGATAGYAGEWGWAAHDVGEWGRAAEMEQEEGLQHRAAPRDPACPRPPDERS